MIKILYSSGKDWGSRTFEIVNGSCWSHVEIVNREGLLVSVLPRIGVCYTALEARKATSRMYALAKIEADEDKVYDFLTSQMWKPHSPLGRICLRHTYYSALNKRWFGAELMAAALFAGGVEVVERHSLYVTPEDLWRSRLNRIIHTNR